MNARELRDWIAEHKRLPQAPWPHTMETILRALRLLAAAEANDGTTPETDALAKLYSTQFQIAEIARSFERERNGLAARVRELEPDAERLNWLEKNPRHSQIIVGDKTADCVFYGLATETLMPLRAAIDAARGSKP